jgi:hypothetical protein
MVHEITVDAQSASRTIQRDVRSASRMVQRGAQAAALASTGSGVRSRVCSAFPDEGMAAARERSQRGVQTPTPGAHIQFSNRQLWLLESGLTHCKQRTATRSNRQLLRGSAFSQLPAPRPSQPANLRIYFRAANRSAVHTSSAISKHNSPVTSHDLLPATPIRVETAPTQTKQGSGMPLTRKWNGRHFAGEFHTRATA